MQIDKQNMEKLGELMLHDAEIKEILCSYDKHIITIPLKLYSVRCDNPNAVLRFEDVKKFEISFCEPWGAGLYISELISNNGENINISEEIEINSDNLFNLTILLNSGDKINVIASKLIYLENDISNDTSLQVY